MTPTTTAVTSTTLLIPPVSLPLPLEHRLPLFPFYPLSIQTASRPSTSDIPANSDRRKVLSTSPDHTSSCCFPSRTASDSFMDMEIGQGPGREGLPRITLRHQYHRGFKGYLHCSEKMSINSQSAYFWSGARMSLSENGLFHET